jgi:serine phosphatase RsbU (regulator of sigma subunit)
MKKTGRILILLGILLTASGVAGIEKYERSPAFYIVLLFGLVSVFLGTSFLFFDLPYEKRKKRAKVLLIIALSISAFIYLWAHFRIGLPGIDIVAVCSACFISFTYLPLLTKNRIDKWKQYTRKKWHAYFLSLGDLISISGLILGYLFRKMHWPGATAMMLLGAIILVVCLIGWNRLFSKEIILRKQAEGKLRDSLNEVEEKNKEITDSIYYAQRIQHALLASDGMLKKNIPEHFVLFKPKDIVSGDFYWACEAHGKFYFVIADSTGHGVPGAFMSLLNISFLNEAINEKGIQKPNDILAHVRSRLISSLAIEGSSEGGNDGMDCILMVLDKNKTKLEVSCAHNPLLILHTNELQEIAADKIPVGKSLKNETPFTLHTIDLKKGDTLYAFTDGFADQFGGPNGKKLKYKQLCQTLLSNKDLPLHKQKEDLLSLFTTWKGSLEQVDDVLIAGIRI